MSRASSFKEPMEDRGFVEAPRPANEEARLRVLRAHEILDTLPEEAFDDVVRLAAEICQVPIALMSLVDEDRQWFKSVVGLDVRETPRSVAFCSHAILQDDIFAIGDATLDPRFRGNPFVQSEEHIRFYAGAPLNADHGHKIGTLCVIDRVPRTLTRAQVRALRTLGNQVQAQLELRLRMLELRRREEEIRSHRDALARVQRQKDELASLIVHDLKNPIASMLPNTQYLLRSKGLSDDHREAVRDIERSAESMHGLVMDLLDVSKSDEGQLTPKWSNVDVGALLANVRQLVGRRAEEVGIELVFSAPAAGLIVRADASLLRRVLENLIDNSLKYTRLTGGKIYVEASPLEGNAIALAVRDEGPGIPERHRARIFDRYAQLERDLHSHAGTSRGLGLAFCRLAVEAHDGVIWVDENAPQGSAFRIKLPVEPRASQRAPEVT